MACSSGIAAQIKILLIVF
ncbi:hypothetical protein EC890511_1167, partial [Escherichia coli 89.0511]